MQHGPSLQFRIEHFGDKKDQVLREKSQASTVGRAILDVEVSERLLPNDGEISKSQHLLEGWEINLGHACAADVDVEHRLEELCEFSIHVAAACPEVFRRKILLEEFTLKGCSFGLRCSCT